TPTKSPQVGFALSSNEELTSADAKPTAPVPLDAASAPQAESEPSASVDVVSDARPPAPALEEPPSVTPGALASTDDAKESARPESSPAEVLFAAVRATIKQLLRTPMKDAEVAAALDVSSAQAKAWLQRLVDEGVIEKRKKPVGYVVKQSSLFE
ncbi:FaeA/PapI family transcriptional regulator, partial [Pseudomonas aeruginosa]